MISTERIDVILYVHDDKFTYFQELQRLDHLCKKHEFIGFLPLFEPDHFTNWKCLVTPE